MPRHPERVLFPVTGEAQADLSDKIGFVVRIVATGSSNPGRAVGVNLVTAQNQVPYGILHTAGNSGEEVAIASYAGEQINAKADTAIAVGALVVGDTDGRVTTAGAGDYAIGIALTAKTGTTEEDVLVKIQPMKL